MRNAKCILITCTAHDCKIPYNVMIKAANHYSGVLIVDASCKQRKTSIVAGLLLDFKERRKPARTQGMEKTANCRSVAVPLINPHFQTRKATRADVPSIAKMIKVCLAVL